MHHSLAAYRRPLPAGIPLGRAFDAERGAAGVHKAVVQPAGLINAVGLSTLIWGALLYAWIG